ncbi:hypothetical protein GCM10009560_74480 [Nonomuraea longicatena]|uniref:DUF5753 domain-containing protein n=2 Tax=Nonomuraea longicatena TaxID=83682 RepID=A0ABP4BR14_9ACTN
MIIGSADVMREQYDFLSAALTLPHVSVGIIPRDRVRSLYPGEGFYIFDGKLVRSELWSGGFRTNQREQVTTFLRAFAMLRDLAVYGESAAALLDGAKVNLQTGENF